MMVAPMQTDEGVSAASAPASLKSPLTIARDEWKIWLACALLSFFLASILMSGWKEGLLPNLAYPYSYSGDFLFHS